MISLDPLPADDRVLGMMRLPFAVLLLSLSPLPHAWARSYDVSLSRLRETPADEAKYRGVAREMGLVLAPLHIGPKAARRVTVV